jgi:hypothetical protein
MVGGAAVKYLEGVEDLLKRMAAVEDATAVAHDDVGP